MRKTSYPVFIKNKVNYILSVIFSKNSLLLLDFLDFLLSFTSSKASSPAPSFPLTLNRIANNVIPQDEDQRPRDPLLVSLI